MDIANKKSVQKQLLTSAVQIKKEERILTAEGWKRKKMSQKKAKKG